MNLRLPVVAAILAIFGAGTIWSIDASKLYVFQAGGSSSLTYNLLFSSAALLIPLAILSGIFFGASDANHASNKVVNGKIERHNVQMFFQHWTHAIGCVTLIITGIALGTLFIPRTIQNVESIGFAMNMHFIGVCFFLFGISYYVTKEALLGELKHMLPHKGDLTGFIGHYKAMILRKPMPPEEKFLCAERVVFPLWIIGVSGIVISGGFKVAAHVWSLPDALMGAMSFLHGVFTIYMTLMLAGHVFAGALLPASWPLIRSLVTGYVTEDYAKHHHELWWKEIEKEMAGDKAAKQKKSNTNVQNQVPLQG